MRFKDWFVNEEGGATTSLMHGGFYGLPFRTTNDNMPFGVRSKYATKDAIPERQTDPDAGSTPPEVTFGFKSKSDKRMSQERPAKTIDRLKKGAPVRDNRPDVIY